MAAEAQSGTGGSTAVVAIVAIVLLVMIGFLFVRGFGRSGGGSGSTPGVKGNVEINVPRPAPK